MSRKLPVLSLIIYYNIPVLSNLTTIWTNYDNYNDRQYFFFFFFKFGKLLLKFPIQSQYLQQKHWRKVWAISSRWKHKKIIYTGSSLDKKRVRFSDPAPSHEIKIKIHFVVKPLKKGLKKFLR